MQYGASLRRHVSELSRFSFIKPRFDQFINFSFTKLVFLRYSRKRICDSLIVYTFYKLTEHVNSSQVPQLALADTPVFKKMNIFLE